jgi:hypothetical protein
MRFRLSALVVLIASLLFVSTASAAQTACPIANGCVGTSTSPAYGSLLIGGQHGEYEFIASSTFSSLTSPVSSVFGRMGAITAQSGDYTTSQVTEDSNLYFTNARAVSALTGQSNTLFTNGAGYLTSLAGAASSTLLTDNNTFSGGNLFLASTTIGNGNQNGGLTISGGATTTGNTYLNGTLMAANGTFSINSSGVINTLNNVAVTLSSTGFTVNRNNPFTLGNISSSNGGTACFNSMQFPCTQLEGGANASSYLQLIGTTAASPSATGGIYLDYGASGASSAMFIQGNSGNVGIATTTPAWPLTVASSTGPQFGLVDTTNSSFAWTLRSTGNSLYIATSTYGATSTTAALAIDKNGNTTVNNLQINGTATTTGTTLRFSNSTPTLVANNVLLLDLDSVNGPFFEGGSSVNLTGNRPIRLMSTGSFQASDVEFTLKGTSGVAIGTGSGGSSGTLYAGTLAVGTSTPWGLLSVQAPAAGGNTPLFVVASSTPSATTTAYMIASDGHIIASSTSPTLSSCGTAPAMTGDDTHGRITVGSTANACTLTFQIPYSATPVCVANNETGSVTNTFSYVPSTTGITFTETSLGGDVVDYLCEGVSGAQ